MIKEKGVSVWLKNAPASLSNSEMQWDPDITNSEGY